MDGTPIYDIKPYVAYADSHPEARSGFVDKTAWQELEVFMPEDLCESFSDEELASLRKVLALDPRPRYQEDPERVYGMPFTDYDVRFKVSGQVLTVVDCVPSAMDYESLWHRLTVLYEAGEAKAIVRLVLEERFGFSLADILSGKLESLSDADKKRIAELSQEAFSYKIQGVYNVKEYNGFYACLIDKGNGEKSIGIRGSEDIRNKENFRHDWKDNDFGLVQRRETSQQKEVRYMLEYFKDTRQLDDLKKLTVAGHSLGGNLASHAAVVMAEDGFEDWNEELDKVYNLDGPGVSKKYLDSHKEQIEKLGERDIVQHAKWSVVGNLLFEIPNSYERELDINENKLDRFMGKKENGLLGKIKRLFCKHSTVCVTPEKKQEDKWELKDGKEDGLSKFLGELSRSVDIFVPEIITFAVGKRAFWMAEKVIVEPENEAKQDQKEELMPEMPKKALSSGEEIEVIM